MLKDRNQDRMQNVRLPRQDTLPSADQIRELYSGAIRSPGKTSELPFGESFVLSVCRPPGSGGCNWILTRWQGTTSAPEWEYDSNDPRWVAQQIIEYFPRWSPHRRAIRDPSEKDPSWSPLVTVDVQQESRVAIMEGELKYVGLPRLLRTIAKDKLTGQLEVDGNNDKAVIFFGDGVAMHCVTSKLDAEKALLDLIGWRNGRFEFHEGQFVNKQTIFRKLDVLLAEASAMGAIEAEPVRTASTPAASEEAAVLADSDKGFVHSFLTNRETGCYTSGAFAYFLELEYNRCHRHNRSFSIVTVESGLAPKNGQNQLEPLPVPVVAEIANLITKAKRKTDLLGHFDSNRLAVLMIEADSATTKAFARRLGEMLVENGSPEHNEGMHIVFTVALAAAPDDATSLEGLIEALASRSKKFGW